MSRFFAVCAIVCLGWFVWEVSPEQYKRWPGRSIAMRKNHHDTEADTTIYITVYQMRRFLAE